jgi:hypothetical protein
LTEYITGSWRPLSGSLLVGQQLADHVDQRVVAHDQQALLAVGGEAHVAVDQREAVRGADGLLAERLHVERHLLLALADEHARVEDARLHHRDHALAQQLGADLGAQGPTALPSASRTRISENARSLVDLGSVSTGGRRTSPAGETWRYEKSVAQPGRPVGSGTCRLKGSCWVIGKAPRPRWRAER